MGHAPSAELGAPGFELGAWSSKPRLRGFLLCAAGFLGGGARLLEDGPGVLLGARSLEACEKTFLVRMRGFLLGGPGFGDGRSGIRLAWR